MTLQFGRRRRRLAILGASLLAAAGCVRDYSFLDGGAQDVVDADAPASICPDSILDRPTRNPSAEFSSTANPVHGWEYGWSVAPGQSFTRYPASMQSFTGRVFTWRIADSMPTPSLIHNSDVVVRNVGSYVLDPGQLALTPGTADVQSVLRWTVPTSGGYLVNARFASAMALSRARPTVRVQIFHNGVRLHEGTLNLSTSDSASEFVQAVTLSGCDKLDFAVSSGDGDNADDLTTLELNITPM